MTIIRKDHKSPLEKMAREVAIRTAALQALLGVHRCNTIPTLTVRECISGGYCKCSCELFISEQAIEFGELAGQG